VIGLGRGNVRQERMNDFRGHDVTTQSVQS
jgi:hypothetical protein